MYMKCLLSFVFIVYLFYITFFQISDEITRPCFPRCLSCNICDHQFAFVKGCPVNGCYGFNNSLPCPDVNCHYCHRETGTCELCKRGYKGFQCEIGNASNITNIQLLNLSYRQRVVHLSGHQYKACFT